MDELKTLRKLSKNKAAMEIVRTSEKNLKVRTFIGLIALLVVGLCGGVMWTVHSNAVETVGVNKANALAAQVMTFRSFYVQQIVPRAKESGKPIHDDWDPMPHTLPQPAMLINVLGQQIQKEHPGTAIRLYRRYPLPHRKEVEVFDQFEKDAFKALEQNPKIPFYRKEIINGRLSMRYAIVDTMRPDCVSCQDSHPETPSQDWKVADVREVVEIIIPIDQVHSVLSNGGMFLLVCVALGIFMVVWFSIVIMKKPQHEAERVSSAILELLADNAD